MNIQEYEELLDSVIRVDGEFYILFTRRYTQHGGLGVVSTETGDIQAFYLDTKAVS